MLIHFRCHYKEKFLFALASSSGNEMKKSILTFADNMHYLDMKPSS